MGSTGTTSSSRSAVILEFPKRPGMAGPIAGNGSGRPFQSVVPVPAYEDGWYHAEAIEEERLRRERDGSTSH